MARRAYAIYRLFLLQKSSLTPALVHGMPPHLLSHLSVPPSLLHVLYYPGSHHDPAVLPPECLLTWSLPLDGHSSNYFSSNFHFFSLGLTVVFQLALLSSAGRYPFSGTSRSPLSFDMASHHFNDHSCSPLNYFFLMNSQEFRITTFVGN